MKESNGLIPYILFSMIGLGIIMLGIIASNFELQILSFASFFIGIVMCVHSFFMAQKK